MTRWILIYAARTGCSDKKWFPWEVLSALKYEFKTSGLHLPSSGHYFRSLISHLVLQKHQHQGCIGCMQAGPKSVIHTYTRTQKLFCTNSHFPHSICISNLFATVFFCVLTSATCGSHQSKPHICSWWHASLCCTSWCTAKQVNTESWIRVQQSDVTKHTAAISSSSARFPYFWAEKTFARAVTAVYYPSRWFSSYMSLYSAWNCQAEILN